MTCDLWWLWLLLYWTNPFYYLNYWVSLGRFYLLDIHCDYFLISPLCGVAQTPDCGMLVIYLLYKPFMWCRSDARLRHAFCCRPFEASLQTPDRCIFISILGLHIHVLYEQPACVQHGFWFHDWRCDHRIFQSMIIVCYIIPVFIMFASTFKVLTGLSLAIVLARFLARRGATVMTAPEPKQRW